MRAAAMFELRWSARIPLARPGGAGQLHLQLILWLKVHRPTISAVKFGDLPSSSVLDEP
jgi:hypothetical protein